MTMDGNHPQTDIEATSNEASRFLKSGMQHNSLSEAVFQADESIRISNVSGEDRLKLSQAIGPKLAEEGILGRAMQEYGLTNFKDLSHGDDHIEIKDLDKVLDAGLESTSPVKGMIARSLKDNIDDIAMAHKDHNGAGKIDLAKERDKGISAKDLQKWGERNQQRSLNAEMGSNMAVQFGTTEQWNKVAGEDGLISKDDLKQATKDTVKFNPSERATLNFMHDNFKTIRDFQSGDSNSEISISDVVGWSDMHSDKTRTPEQIQSQSIAKDTVGTDIVDDTANIGLRVIESGLKDGDLTGALRALDNHLITSGFDQAQIVGVNAKIQEGLQSHNLLGRVVGQYASENFEGLKGDDKYVHPTELDPLLNSKVAAKHPSEIMILNMLKSNSDNIALHHDDVTSSSSDSAEQNRGISRGDVTAFNGRTIERKHSVDMSKNMLELFGHPQDFVRLSEGLRELTPEQMQKLGEGTLSNADFVKAFNVTQDELDAGKFDTLRFNEKERNTLAYIRDNWSSIKDTVKDGKNITIDDVFAHAKANSVTLESIKEEKEAQNPEAGLVPDVLLEDNGG